MKSDTTSAVETMFEIRNHRRVTRAANLSHSPTFLFLNGAIWQKKQALNKISALLKSRAKVKLEPAEVVRGLWEIVLLQSSVC